MLLLPLMLLVAYMLPMPLLMLYLAYLCHADIDERRRLLRH